MAQFEASLRTAENYIATLGPNQPARLRHGQMLLNGFPTSDRRSGHEWFHLVETDNHSGPCLVLFHMGRKWKDAQSALYVVDSGVTVTPHYVAGWNESGGFLILSPMTVSRRYPYLTSLMTPRRAYTLYLVAR